MPEIHVPLVHGLHEGIDPKLLPDGWLSRAENVRFRKDGRLGSRFGYDFVSGSAGQAVGSGSFGPKHTVFIYNKSTSAAVTPKWSDRRADGTYTTAAVASCTSTLGVPRRLPSTRNTRGMVASCDMDYCGSYLFEAFHDFDYDSSTGYDLVINIYEALSHRLVSTIDLQSTTARNVKVVTLSTSVLVFYADSSDAIKATIIDSVALTSSTVTVVTAASGRAFSFDVAPSVAEGRILLVYESSATNIRWGKVDTTGFFTSFQNQATANPSRMSITLTRDSTVALVWAEGATFQTGDVHYLESQTDGTPITAKTTIDSSGTATGFPVAGPGGTVGDDFFFAWNLTSNQMKTYRDGFGAQAFGFLAVASKPFLGWRNEELMWCVNRVVSGDTASPATYKLIDIAASGTFIASALKGASCQAVSCQRAALPGAYLTTSHASQTYIDNRRFGIEVPTVLSNATGNDHATASALPVLTARGFGADVVRIDTDTWADRLFPAKINGQLLFSGPRVIEFDGSILHESGLADGPELVTVTDTAAGNLSAGTYQYIVTYEWFDAGGRRHRSPLSPIAEITLASARSVAVGASAPSFSDKFSGYFVSIGFRVWRTTADGTIFYLVNSSSVPPANLLGTTMTVLTDNVADADIIDNEVLYTAGERGGASGLLENVEPPPCRFIWAGSSRVILGGLEDAAEVQWSKLVFPGEPVQFADNDAFRARVDGDVTAVASLDGVWYVFTATSIWAFSGEGPEDNGAGGTFGEPRKLPSDVGCIAQRSVLEVPRGLLFQGRSDAIYLLPRGGGAPEWVGQQVRDTLASFPVITSSVLLSNQNIAVFSCVTGTTNGRLLVYDTRNGEWTIDIPFNGASASSRTFNTLAVYNGKLLIDGQIAETAAYADDESGSQNRAIVGTFVTGDIRPFGVLGHGRMRRVVMLSEYRSATTFTIEESVDGGVTYQTAASFTPSNSAGDTVKTMFDLPIVRGEAFRFRIISTPTSPGEGFVFNNLTCEVFPAGGTPKLANAYRV